MQQMETDLEKIEILGPQSSHIQKKAELKRELKRAALLAWEGHLTSVKYMHIRNINVSYIPLAQMEELTSTVTGRVRIDNLINISQLSSILTRVQCTELVLRNMELSEENTRALVTTMREKIE